MTTGPYHLIRHPIYAAVCLFTVAGAAATVSWPAAGLAVLVLAGAVVRLRCEEFLLTSRYPRYADYVVRTWRLIPYVD